MKKRNISIGVAIAIAALLFAGTGIALAGEENVEDFYFYQESMVEGTGLVMVDKDINTVPAPGYPSHNLETNLHIHGCGDYEVDQVLKVVIVKNYYTPNGTWNRDVSQSIDYCEDAMMTFKPVALTSGSMTLIDDESSILWKEDLCIKNYQIDTAMRAKYTDASYIKKTIESNVSCVEPYLINNEAYPGDPNYETTVSGCGIAKMDILSTVSGASHIGVVVKARDDPHITMIRVSEDYIGNFTIDKHMKVKMNKPGDTGKDGKEWLPCPFEADLGHAEFYEGDC
uniref:Uncharacterized protein n=1 Tax=Candidatus Methanophaga sp. ANME-1 ERB7 TaxID=2759913 RepID=A0A7G9Z3W7_9EURY|nr:hypothetical protein MCEIKFBD_00012 [Methanosarcinales archaeon ANME-1 ERB7]